MSKRILSLDAETNGLWGEAFSIGAVLYEDGREIKSFIARCPITGKVDTWVEENVLPAITGVLITHHSYKDMLDAFCAFYLEHKKNTEIIVHMGLPVEVKLFIDAYERSFIGDWDAPYPLIDISAFPEIGTSVDDYNKKHNIVIPSRLQGGTHNPLYDSRAALSAYLHIIQQ